MKYFLFLDDLRMPKQATIGQRPLSEVSGIGNTQWHIVRNLQAFCSIVLGKGVPEVVTFDHDLCEDHMRECVQKWDKFNYDLYRDTGLAAAEWLCHYCRKEGVPFPKWFVHSFNPIGSENIKKFIEGFPHVK